MIHYLLPDGVARRLKHFLNSPEKDHVVAAQLNREGNTNKGLCYAVYYPLSPNIHIQIL